MSTAIFNPRNASEYIEITTITCTGNMVIKVLNTQGKIAKIIRQTGESSIDKVRLNMEDLCKGKYIINIFTDDHFIKAIQYTKN